MKTNINNLEEEIQTKVENTKSQYKKQIKVKVCI